MLPRQNAVRKTNKSHACPKEVDRFKRTPQAATINRELACLRSILILAAKDGIIEKVPYVKLLEEKNTRSRVATQQELKALLKVSLPHLQ